MEFLERQLIKIERNYVFDRWDVIKIECTCNRNYKGINVKE